MGMHPRWIILEAMMPHHGGHTLGDHLHPCHARVAVRIYKVDLQRCSCVFLDEHIPPIVTAHHKRSCCEQEQQDDLEGTPEKLQGRPSKAEEAAARPAQMAWRNPRPAGGYGQPNCAFPRTINPSQLLPTTCGSPDSSFFYLGSDKKFTTIPHPGTSSAKSIPVRTRTGGTLHTGEKQLDRRVIFEGTGGNHSKGPVELHSSGEEKCPMISPLLLASGCGLE
jgi:hypothetical protein